MSNLLPPPPDSDAIDDQLDEVDLREVLGVLRRHVKLIALVALLATAAAGWLAHRARPLYQAGAVIRLVDTRQALTGGLDDAAAVGKMTGLGSFTDPVLSQLQVLQSRGVMAEVVDRHPLGLRLVASDFPASILRDVRVPADAPGDTLEVELGDSAVVIQARAGVVHAAYGAPVDVDDVHFVVTRPSVDAKGTLIVVPRHEAIDQLQEDLGASQRKNTDVIDVTYAAHDSVVAKEVVNTTVQAYQEQNAVTARDESRRRREFVQTQLEQTDSILAEAQRALSDFQSSRQVYGTQERVSAEQAGLMELDIQRGQMDADRQVYQSLIAGISTRPGAVNDEKLRALVSSPGIAENPVVVQLYTQLVEYQGAHDSLSTGQWGSASTNPDVQKLDTLIATTQARLVSAVRSHIDALDARIAALDTLKARNARELQALPGVEATEARLVQRVATTRRMADQLREEYQKARIAEAVEVGQVEIVDLAVTPDEPLGRGPLFKLVLGLMVGLMLGSGGAFLVEHLNTAIRRKDEIEHVLQIPGLAIIPRIANGNGNGARARLAGLGVPRLRASQNGNGVAGNGKSLVTVHDQRSGSAEAFRTLRTNLIFSQAVQSLHTIVVTSPSPGDGKTTTSSNLAVTFAQQGLRVILVDCDLRRARLHNVFHTTREPGLTQLLLGQATAEQCVRSTLVDGLSFLPAGALPPNPSELLGGPRMRELLDALHGEYDMVLLDTPPVHVAADSAILGAAADGVILVLRAGGTDRDSAQDALQRLRAVNARVVGAVLNDPDRKVPQYGGGAYYYEYYGEG